MRLAILLLCFAATIAHAQPGNSSSTTPTTSTASSDDKSSTTAVVLSVGVPLLGAAATFGSHGNGGAILFGVNALFFGPSLGRWYAGESGGGTLAIRGAGILALGAGVIGMYGISESDCRANDQPCHSPLPFQALALGGTAMIFGSWAYDVVQAKRGVDRWNVRHHVSVTPALIGGTDAPGVFVSGQF